MNVELPDDYYDVQESVDRLLTDRAGVETLRALWEGGPAEPLGLWSELAHLGMSGLAVAERRGGAGLPILAAIPLVESVGKFAVPQPVAESLGVVAPLLAAEEGNDIASRHLAGLLDGTEIGSIQDGWDGHAAWAAECDVVLVLDGNHVALCEPSPRTVVAIEGIDPSRRIGRVLPAAEITRLAGADVGGRARSRALLIGAALLMGLADGVIWRSVEYAKERVQFGRPIGSFQAIKHQLADAYTSWEFTRRYLWYAAVMLEEESGRGAEAAVTAKALAGDVATRASYVGTQVHGGYGYTWECDLHLWLKRIQVLDGWLGSSVDHWRALGQQIDPATRDQVR
jgi:alkylation response protein AidB-like acyl-CoA dehydrogenase